MANGLTPAWQVLIDLDDSVMKKTLPEVEELETDFYEDGIQSLAMSLRTRQIEATEHWKGNKNFSQFDLMQMLVENLQERRWILKGLKHLLS